MSSPGTVLLVDDDVSVISFLSFALAQDGFMIAQATSGREALARYDEIQPDLIILDVGMPEMDGLTTCRHLIAAHGEECAPIIFYTSKIAPEEIAEGFEAGGADYLPKPSDINETRARVHSHIQSHLLAKQQHLLVEQLRRAHAAKNRFIGMAAHDLRNPLVSIRGFAEFLMDGTMGPMPTRQLALVSIIQGTSAVMLKTLNELLDVATIEAGQLQLQQAPHNLVDVIARSIAQSAIPARKKRAKILFEPPVEPIVVSLDADKMRQVIDILLNNAIQYSPAGEVVTVTLEASPTQNSCRVAVRDNGPGIPEEAREKLFRQLTGLAPESSSRDKNSGVGLIICRNIVDAHGGRIAAENLPGRGCELSITLPLDASAGAPTT